MSTLQQQIKDNFGNMDVPEYQNDMIHIINKVNLYGNDQSWLYYCLLDIAKINTDGELFITNRYRFTTPIRECLNSLPGVNIEVKGIDWILNGVVWDGNFKRVPEYKQIKNEVATHE